MYFQDEFYQYMRQLHSFVESQNEKIKQMESTIDQLQNEVEELKNEKHTTIDKIEYKFDQLKVETLSGTLNIGLNPQDTNAIEDFAVTQDQFQVPPIEQLPEGFSQQVFNDVHSFLDRNSVDLIKKIEKQQDFALDDSYRQFMIEDVKKQINPRINYYINKLTPADIQNPAQAKRSMERIVSYVKKDIENSFLAFIQHFPRNIGGEDK
ncbi:spore germination protein GerPC [Cytobacillus sp. IB215665]|uniref:spore germination protein GerPC n=1 Tax=Cytobacillus sp. IB215665 TaxID=3097357 RepID=UPI002A143C88|nr:spore germination protein GerPC [Cytobacillus sp. IB215665]MDX8364531.1 spore germination protein GerPC [Cytobacillus sp. IB215665]